MTVIAHRKVRDLSLGQVNGPYGGNPVRCPILGVGLKGLLGQRTPDHPEGTGLGMGSSDQPEGACAATPERSANEAGKVGHPWAMTVVEACGAEMEAKGAVETEVDGTTSTCLFDSL